MADHSAVGQWPARWQREFLRRQQLPASYLEVATRWFDPLALRLLDAAAVGSRPLLVGINGCQGSGKSTLCDYLATRLTAVHGSKVVTLSLDDVYHTRDQRRQLAADVHPLFATRGVPGTHDMLLLRRTLNALQSADHSHSVEIPRFDKGTDDRVFAAHWERVRGPIDMILLEGWCLGAQPVSVLEPPINTLEAAEDADAGWRRHINGVLAAEFVPLYAEIGFWVMLRAPDFDCVYRWRLEQEQKLALTGKGDAVMSDAQLARFVQHYERLTRHCLAALAPAVDVLYQLDDRRAVSFVTVAGETATVRPAVGLATGSGPHAPHARHET